MDIPNESIQVHGEHQSVKHVRALKRAMALHHSINKIKLNRLPITDEDLTRKLILTHKHNETEKGSLLFVIFLNLYICIVIVEAIVIFNLLTDPFPHIKLVYLVLLSLMNRTLSIIILLVRFLHETIK